MAKADKPSRKKSQSPSAPQWLQPAWNQFWGRVAASAGAGCALLSLLRDAPLSTACARGAIALFSCLVLGRLGGRLLEWRGAPAAVDKPDAADPVEPELPGRRAA